MKKFAAILMAILMTLSLVLSLTACGGDKEKTPETSNADSTAQSADAETEGTTAPAEVSLAAKGKTCTITVPKLKTFIDGYEIVNAGCNDSTAIQNIYVKLYKEDPMIEINVSIQQLTVSNTKTQDAKGYAEYYNGKNLGPYEPVEIAGYSGYLKTKSSDSTKVSDNWYIIDFPLSDGTSIVIDLYVGQKYADDTSAMAPIAEAFLKNIEVAPNNS